MTVAAQGIAVVAVGGRSRLFDEVTGEHDTDIGHRDDEVVPGVTKTQVGPRVRGQRSRGADRGGPAELVAPMDFSGEMAAIQQQLARCHDMVVRRGVVLGVLAAAPGERILELGCGAGSYLREIGVAVGENGHAVGLDVSHDQVGAAASHCDGMAQVEARVGDLQAVPASDDEYDATVSVQVLEYVADVGAGVAEVARVTRPGGRFVNLATNWGALFWTGGDATLTDRMLSAWGAHAPHPNLPVALPSLLRTAGFGAVRQEPVTIVNRRFHPNTFSYGAARLMAAFALSTGDVDQAAAVAWIESLETADSAGDFFVSSVPVLTTATWLG